MRKVAKIVAHELFMSVDVLIVQEICSELDIHLTAEEAKEVTSLIEKSTIELPPDTVTIEVPIDGIDVLKLADMIKDSIKNQDRR